MNTRRQLILLVLGFAVAPSVHGETIFHYRVSQGDGRALPMVRDVGGAENHGTADSTTRLNADVPVLGVPPGAGSRSINGGGQGGVNSGGTAELANSAIADAGGFTMETWFLWGGGGTINSLIDYAGSEKLVLDTSVGSGSEVRMRINSDPSMDSIIGSISPGQWHYVAAVFDTEGNVVQGGSIAGKFRLFLDGMLTGTTDELVITNFGDSLNRPIGVSKHPLNFEADGFDGLIYEPRVSLGALVPGELLFVVPEPSPFVLLSLGTLTCIGLGIFSRSLIRR